MKLEDRLRNFFELQGSLIRFITGTALLTIVFQFIYDLAKDNTGLGGAAILASVLLVIFFIILLYDYISARQLTKTEIHVDEEAPKKQGLVLLVSNSTIDHSTYAYEHHLERLAHCWLISTEESKDNASKLQQEIQARPNNQVRVHNIVDTIVDADDPKSTYDAINQIFLQAEDLHIPEQEIICDITGGTKMMSVGMSLACSKTQRQMQYIKTNKEDGKPKEGGPKKAMLIRTSPWFQKSNP
ncbi:hypothetical protein KQH40_01340 [bacterium]|nr:hypothetical protein [bacterium]